MFVCRGRSHHATLFFGKSFLSEILLIVLFFGLGLIGSTAKAENREVLKGPAPEWVKPRPIPKYEPDDDPGSNGGTRVLMIDEQINLPAHQSHGHYVRAFTSQSGVQEGSRITFSFDPSYQQLTLHQLRIHRDGQVLDRLAGAQVRVLAREESLDRHLYDGNLSAIIDVEDVQVGDVLEYAFSFTGENPVFAGEFSDFYTTQFQTPLKDFSLRILAPESLSLRHRSRGPEPKFSKEIIRGASSIGTSESSPAENMVEYHWEAKDVPSVFYEGEYPSWFSPYGWLQVSSYPDWAAVGQWAFDFYRVPEVLPAPVEAKLEELRQTSDPQAQILGVLEFVQNKIRYLSVSTGVHAYRPYPIEDVINRGFGDCKDKALLTTAMLNRLGFDAAPALVETRFAQTIAEWLPSPHNFDHVVVALDWNGRRYWLDPTRDFQGGRLEDRYFPPYGKAFIIREGSGDLTSITPSGFDSTKLSESKVYDIAGYDQPVHLTIETDYQGREADWMRYSMASQSRNDLEHNYLNYITKQHGEVTPTDKPKFDDDARENVISSLEKYQIKSLWKPGQQLDQKLYAEFHPYLINDFVSAPQYASRKGPLAVAYPKRISETFEVNLPDDSFFQDEDFEVNDPAFTYSSKTRFHNRKLTITYLYESLKDSVPADRVAEYLENLRQVRNNLGYSIFVPETVVNGGAPAAPSSLNWMLILLATFVTVISIVGAVLVFFWHPSWRPRPAHPRYKGLNGWLIVVALGLFSRPLMLIAALIQSGSVFNTVVWDNLTRPGQSSYHPLWLPTLLLELGLQIPLLIFSLLLIVLFFMRRRTFPVIFIIVVGTIFIFSILDGMLVLPLSQTFPNLGIENPAKAIVQTFIQAAIWIPYMLRSQRVAATFTK